jgi:hypothetical protein
MRLHDVAATAAWVAIVILGTGCSATVTATPSGGEPTPPNCSPDQGLVCSGGGDGWSCAAGDNPEDEEANFSCSVPEPNGPDDDYCCIELTASSTSCSPVDASFSGDASFVCGFGSYGYQCLIGDDPSSLDPNLTSANCSESPDSDAVHDDFCCT